jgi:hypothetical protein
MKVDVATVKRLHLWISLDMKVHMATAKKTPFFMQASLRKSTLRKQEVVILYAGLYIKVLMATARRHYTTCTIFYTQYMSMHMADARRVHFTHKPIYESQYGDSKKGQF